MRKKKRYKKLKVAVIGAGFMGELHARALSTLPGVSLFGVFDINFERAKALSKKFKTRFFEDYKALLREVDAIVLSSPTKSHFEIGMACIEERKHLFLEKPLASSSYEGKLLVDAAKTKEGVLATGHIERFNPAYLMAQKLLRREKPLILNIKRLSPFSERITDASVVTDMMIHDLDLALCIAGSPPDSVKAKGKKIKTKLFDHVFASVLFENGLIANIEANRTSPSKVRELEIVCEKGNIIVDLLGKKVYRELLIDPMQPFDFPRKKRIPVKKSDQITAELKDFVSAVKKRRPPKVSGEAGLLALSLAEEIERSASRKK